MSAGAGNIAAKTWNRVLSSTIGLPQTKELIATLKSVDLAENEIRKVFKDGESKLEKHFWKQTFPEYGARLQHIIRESATNQRDLDPSRYYYPDDLADQLNDPAGTKAARDKIAEFYKAEENANQKNLQDIAKSESKPLVKRIAADTLERNRQNPEGGTHYSLYLAEQTLKADAFRKAFGSEVFKSAQEYLRNLSGRINFDDEVLKANPKMKLAVRLLDGLGTISEKRHQKMLSVRKSMKSEYEGRKFSANKSTLVGAVIGGVAPALGYFGSNIVDEKRLKSCSGELGLSQLEMRAFGSRFLGSPPAISNTRNGLLNFSCEKIGFVNPAESVIGIMNLNNGEVPAGTCKIIENELKRMNAIVGDSSASPEVSCNSFSMANVKLVGPNGNKIFKFKDGNQTYEAPWNSETSYPNLAHTKIFDSLGNVDRKLTTEFVTRYNFMHPPSAVEKNPGFRDMASSCDMNSALNCRLINAAVKAKVYSNSSRGNCDGSTQADAAERSTDKPAVK